MQDLLNKGEYDFEDYLFQGKDIQTGEWVYGGVVWEGKRRFIVTHLSVLEPGDLTEYKITIREVVPETIGRWIMELFGGVRVFEGDVCQCSVDGIKGECLPIDRHVGLVHRDNIGGIYLRYCKAIKKLGNFHDNPSLLPNQDLPF